MTGAELREMRESINLHQTDLAEITGISQPAISAYENGAKIPEKIENLIRLSLRGVKPVDRPDPSEIMPPEKIRDIRRRYMLRRRRFGLIIGVSESSVKKYETGERRPSQKVIGKLMELDG